MKVIYNGTGAMNSNGKRFEPGTEYELEDGIAEYYIKTFGEKTFTLVVEAEAVEPAKPVRKKRTKKAVPTEE